MKAYAVTVNGNYFLLRELVPHTTIYFQTLVTSLHKVVYPGSLQALYLLMECSWTFQSCEGRVRVKLRGHYFQKKYPNQYVCMGVQHHLRVVFASDQAPS